ncbi:exo-alpha-sialidase [Trypanosoma cruzi]|nr:exo-alpha-sialidase [Trypanosoma cruzi]
MNPSDLSQAPSSPAPASYAAQKDRPVAVPQHPLKHSLLQQWRPSMPTQELKHQHYFPPQRSQLHRWRIITTSRSSTAEANTRRDMLGLCGSLSPPSLLLPLDPVTRRRLCVRGAFTAATRESM